MRIIIALDIIEGKCVRLTRGDFSTIKVYNENPVEVAKMIEDNGIKYLHLVDLDGARNRKVTNHTILEKITSVTSLNVDFGGGLRTTDDLRIVFDSGASQISSGSIPVTDRQLFLGWINQFTPERIILAADSHDRMVVSDGWTESAGIDVVRFIDEYRALGVSYVLCTDTEKDGMLQGPPLNLYKEILPGKGIKLIASGGISTLGQLKELSDAGCEGAIIGKALYEGKLNLNDLSRLC